MRGEGVKIDLGAKLLRLDLELYGAEQKKKTTSTYLVSTADREPPGRVYGLNRRAWRPKLLCHKVN